MRATRKLLDFVMLFFFSLGGGLVEGNSEVDWGESEQELCQNAKGTRDIGFIFLFLFYRSKMWREGM